MGCFVAKERIWEGGGEGTGAGLVVKECGWEFGSARFGRWDICSSCGLNGTTPSCLRLRTENSRREASCLQHAKSRLLKKLET